MLFSLRLAHVLHRRRMNENIPEILVQSTSKGFKISLPKQWVKERPLTEFSIKKEADDWAKIGHIYEIDYF